MNDNLQKALADILNKASQGVDSATSFMQAQLPDIVSQLLAWKIWEYSFFILLSLVLFVLIYKSVKKINANIGDDYGDKLFTWVMATVIAMIPLTVFVFCSLNVIEVLVAPKIYLIEYAAHLLKKD